MSNRQRHREGHERTVRQRQREIERDRETVRGTRCRWAHMLNLSSDGAR